MSIHNRFTLVRVFGAALLLVFAGALQAAQWSAPLKGGGTVTVDPDTNRATLRRNGVETPLWDGVHQLEDGSTLTIRSGTAVPNQDILRARELPKKPPAAETDQWVGAPIVGYSPCEKLVRRVCGVDRACSAAEACDPARQLLDMEQRERAANASPNYMTPASGQCQQAEQDRTFFTSCRAAGTRRTQ
ncbi:MAG TPA: hypothetical protein ENK49_01720 [Gammaproteobacteria bacterium]|nr:hypothetical protein [Gammaproteobacteria bacterium]